MYYREYQPHPSLQPFVENYWILRTEAGKEEVVVPDGNTSLMFLSTGVKRLDIEKQTTLQTGKNAVVVGQKSRPVLYQFDPGPALETIGVRFRPAGLPAFTQMPMVRLRDQVISATEIFEQGLQQATTQVTLTGGRRKGLQQATAQVTLTGGRRKGLQQETAQVTLTGGRRTLVDTLNRFLIQNLQTQQLHHHSAMQMTEHIIRCQGQYRAADCMQRFHLSERQIERLFRQFVGLTPKTFARIVRFNHTIVCHQRQTGLRLTDLAYVNGYFDQMHFVKEVKSFTLKTPKQYFRYSAEAWSQPLCALLDKRFVR
ncbi:MAG: AraC family transcriptional regulator [Lewinellaceae bacterium]|nr:AraC family transcriptional regulator [Saprospiraceae bacterium]MCB9332052.1 AraC family transcriptional regulator [Lewinellaceae bacterium]